MSRVLSAVVLQSLLCGALVAMAGPAHALLAVVDTDASWRAIGPVGNQEGTPIGTVGAEWEAVNPGWNTGMSYDDSDPNGWHESVVTASDAFFNYIWSDPSEFFGATPSYFRKSFVVNGPVTLGLLDFYADDDAQIWLNGHLVVNDVNNTASTQFDIDVSPFFVAGTNLLAVKAHDSWPYAPPGTNYQNLALHLEMETAPAVPEATTGLLVAIALLVVAGTTARRRT